MVCCAACNGVQGVISCYVCNCLNYRRCFRLYPGVVARPNHSQKWAKAAAIAAAVSAVVVLACLWPMLVLPEDLMLLSEGLGHAPGAAELGCRSLVAIHSCMHGRSQRYHLYTFVTPVILRFTGFVCCSGCCSLAPLPLWELLRTLQGFVCTLTHNPVVLSSSALSVCVPCPDGRFGR